MPRWQHHEFEPDCTKAPEAFFPASTGSANTLEAERAKSICRQCRFRQPCLDWAIENHEWGIWGGTTEDERQHIVETGHLPEPTKKYTRYELYQRTQRLMTQGFSLAEIAERIGLSKDHIIYQRAKVKREIAEGVYRP